MFIYLIFEYSCIDMDWVYKPGINVCPVDLSVMLNCISWIGLSKCILDIVLVTNIYRIGSVYICWYIFRIICFGVFYRPYPWFCLPLLMAITVC